MAQLNFGSAGVTAVEADLSGIVTTPVTDVGAGVIGTAAKGPVFVPVTLGSKAEFFRIFGNLDGTKFGPLAVNEWLTNAAAVTYLRVLGVGDGKTRLTSGNYAGSVLNAGFVVGENQPNSDTGILQRNPFANAGGPAGRTYFLGCMMSESNGSNIFSSAGLQGPGSVTPGDTTSVPIIRGVVLAASGVILRLSSSVEGTATAPATSLIANESNSSGVSLGTVNLSSGQQEFVLFLNGHKGTNVITASFDMTANNYFGNVLNTDPYQLQSAGHCLYSKWDIYPALAAVTGSGLLNGTVNPYESAAFIVSGSSAYNAGTSTVPNFENFEDRFSYASTPWVISQNFGGSPVNLFKIVARDAGANISSTYKFSIENISPSTDPSNPYGTFDFVVRSANDTDLDQVLLEPAYRGLTLDPNDTNYIARRIGDAYVYYDFDRSDSEQRLVQEGNYAGSSRLIRVQMNPSVDDGIVDASALPMGFRGVQHLMTSGSAPLATVSSTALAVSTAVKRAVTPPVPFRSTITRGADDKISVEPNLYWGVEFEHETSASERNVAATDAKNYANKSIAAFSAFYPSMLTNVQKFAVGDNDGAADTTANGIVDADRFTFNKFTLENIQVVTGSNTYADKDQWVSATYVRNGNITANNTNKTRRLKVDDLNVDNKKFAKFNFMMTGGFDGVNIFNADEAQLLDSAVKADASDTNRGSVAGPNVKAYRKALDIMKNTSAVDIKVLAIPGIRHRSVTDQAISAVTDRFDAIYIMDPEQYEVTSNAYVVSGSMTVSVSNTITQHAARSIDSSFTAVYFPDVNIVWNQATGATTRVPPSVPVLGAFALNDALGWPWFAPAGFTRGALSTTSDVTVNLSKVNLDNLYDNRINPIAKFVGQSNNAVTGQSNIVVFGQKTSQIAASALDRVNVRRLLIEIRRQVRDVARSIIFEPNREATLARFSAAVTPRLQRIQNLSGLDRFKVVIDSSTTTQQDVENNTVRGKIFVQPTKSIEFISLSFEVTNAGAQLG